MMSQSICTHAIMLTVFNLASTSPRFRHTFCLQARPLHVDLVVGCVVLNLVFCFSPPPSEPHPPQMVALYRSDAAFPSATPL